MSKKPTAAATGDHTEVVAKLIKYIVVPIREEVLKILYDIVTDRLAPGTDVTGLDRGINSRAERVQNVAIEGLVRLMADPQFRESLHADRARSLALTKALRNKPLTDAIRNALRGQPRTTKQILELLVANGALVHDAKGYKDPKTGTVFKLKTLDSKISRIRKWHE